EAAEMAIASPLLEDVNLAGAKGILVNVTAGLDMSIGEFEEVGNTVKEFASENATVVVGTVIDPNMNGDLRVTVVATGIGGGIENIAPQPVTLVKKNDGQVDYNALERPTVMRNQVVNDRYATAAATESPDMDYLDIPAFLRRQAD
ncbi:MAG: cell division protein FtsZ, partial [Gammaproteobacteria bacterium]|nr:cell division protein FtsZ [Gammaproteobacteria bacterium]